MDFNSKCLAFVILFILQTKYIFDFKFYYFEVKSNKLLNTINSSYIIAFLLHIKQSVDLAIHCHYYNLYTHIAAFIAILFYQQTIVTTKT